MIYPVFAQANPPAPNTQANTTSGNAAATTMQSAPVNQAAQANQAGVHDTKQITEQPAPPADDQQAQPGMKDGLLGMAPFIIIVVVMFFLMYRSQKKEQKRRQEMIDNTKKGDTVLTIGGIYGEIVEIHEDRFILKVADGVKIAVAKTAVAATPNSAKNEGEKAEKK